MNPVRKLIVAGAGLACIVAPLAANAFVISYTGSGGVTGTANITLSQVAANEIDMFVVVANTTAPQNAEGGPRITAITFGWTPDLSLAAGYPTFDEGTSVFDTLTGASNGYPGFNVDYCATTKNCTGGGAGGLFAGDTDSGFTITFKFTADMTTAFLQSWMQGTLDKTLYPDYGFASCLRFQTVGPNGTDSSKACTRGGGDVPVPEPGSLALLGLGLVGFVAARRRRA